MDSFICLIRSATKTCRWSCCAWWTLPRDSIFRIREAVFFRVMNREDWTLSASSFSSGSWKVLSPMK